MMTTTLMMTIKNMYFREVKSTAHPPIIGALGHSTELHYKKMIGGTPEVRSVKSLTLMTFNI